MTKLSDREDAVGRCLAQGFTDKEIALDLGVEVPTVRVYFGRLADKLQVPHDRLKVALAYIDANPSSRLLWRNVIKVDDMTPLPSDGKLTPC